MEEAGVFNAAYTYAHYGKMSFPVYGLRFFDSFGIHPHLHYTILGLLIRLGLTLYSAEAVIISTVALIAITLILRGHFPETVKLGFLLGLYGTIVLSVMYIPDDAVGVRPELHLTLAWFGGLVALESARLSNWPLPTLCVGVLLVTYAATLQNYALLAPAGLIVYAVWMSLSPPWRETARKLAVCFACGCLIAVPFLLLYVYPNRAMFRANMNWGATHAPPLLSKLSAYLDVYQHLIFSVRCNMLGSFLAGLPVLAALSMRVPLFIAAVVILALRPSTRGMALASLPVPLLAAWVRPEAQYFISEQMLYLSAFWVLVLGAAEFAMRKTTNVRPRLLMLCLSCCCCAIVVLGSPPLREIRSLRRSPLHEMDLARAAARQLVGQNAVVASRHLAWYMSGGTAWYRLENDITEPSALENFHANLYASQFDALADYSLYSDQTQNGTTPSSMYASGDLHLKGFYLAQRMSRLSLLFFQASRAPSIAGYWLHDDQLERFDQDESGSWLFLTLVGDAHHPPQASGRGICYPNIVWLPGIPPAKGISVMLLSRESYLTNQHSLAEDFKILDVVPGRLSTVDAYALVSASQATDRTIRFLRSPQEDVLVNFLSAPDHLVAHGETTPLPKVLPVRPDAPISSGRYAPGFEATNLFAGNNLPWASEALGPRNAFLSYIGADFGSVAPVSVRVVDVQQSSDPASCVEHAVLMASDNNYAWRSVVEFALSKDGVSRMYSVPFVGAHRFWKLVAADDTKIDHAWQINTLRFYQ